MRIRSAILALVSVAAASATALLPGLSAAAPASAAGTSVGSEVTTTLSPSAVLLTPGQPATDTISSTNASSKPLKIIWIAAPLGTSGVTVTPGTGTVTIAPGATVSTSLTITSDGTVPGTTFIPFTVSVAAGRSRLPAVGAYLTTTTPYGDPCLEGPCLAMTSAGTGNENLGPSVSRGVRSTPGESILAKPG